MATYNGTVLTILLTNAGLPIANVSLGANPNKVPSVPGTYSAYTAPDGVTVIGIDWTTPYTPQQNTQAAAIVAAGGYTGTQLLPLATIGGLLNKLSTPAWNLLWAQLSTIVPPATLPPYLLGTGPSEPAIGVLYLVYGGTYTKAVQEGIAAFWTRDNPTWLITPSWDTTGTINISGYDPAT